MISFFSLCLIRSALFVVTVTNPFASFFPCSFRCEILTFGINATSSSDCLEQDEAQEKLANEMHDAGRAEEGHDEIACERTTTLQNTRRDDTILLDQISSSSFSFCSFSSNFFSTLAKLICKASTNFVSSLISDD